MDTFSPMATWWLSNSAMTVKVKTNERGTIMDSAPVVRKFVGQPFRNLCVWMNKRPGFIRVKLS